MCLQDAPWVGRVGGASALPTVCTVGGYCGVQMEALTLHEAPLTAPHQGEGWGVASLPHGSGIQAPTGGVGQERLALHLLRRMSHLPACSLVWGAARSVPHYSWAPCWAAAGRDRWQHRLAGVVSCEAAPGPLARESWLCAECSVRACWHFQAAGFFSDKSAYVRQGANQSTPRTLAAAWSQRVGFLCRVLPGLLSG